jgi:serine/threonine protein kinase
MSAANPPPIPPTPGPALHHMDGRGFLHGGAEPIPGYRLIRPLGKGGFGEVWEAKGPGGFSLALKFIYLQGHAGDVEVRSLDLMKSLRHPNLLSMFGAWERHGYLIVAMELAEGSLYDHLKKAVARGFPGVPMGELLEMLYEAAKGIDFLNEPRHNLGDGLPPSGIQHRDIKPQNILILGGSAKVADFGLAKLLESTVCASSGSMSPAYSAPEFSMGKTTRWSDQYSLAVSYCQLRGNKLPFTGVLSQILAGHMSLPPDLSMIPHEGERHVVARALAKKPEKRWPTCRDFIEGLLDSYARQNPAKARGVKIPSQTASEMRRRALPPPLPETDEPDGMQTEGMALPPPPRQPVLEPPPLPPRRTAKPPRLEDTELPPPVPTERFSRPDRTKQQVEKPKPAPQQPVAASEAEETPADPNRASSLILLAAVLVVVVFVAIVLLIARPALQGRTSTEPPSRHARDFSPAAEMPARL